MQVGKKTICILLPLLIVVAGFFVPADTADAASAFSTSGVSMPSTMEKGKSFVVKGYVSSRVKMTSLYCGVVNSSGKWVKYVYASTNPKAKRYNLYNLDSKIRFGKLSGGKYYYRVWVRDARGTSRTLVNHPFRVLSLSVSGQSTPGNLYYQKGFVVKGRVASSASRINYLRVGIATSSRKWIKGKNVTLNPKARSYDLGNLDYRIPASKLSPGTYYYYVRARDSVSPLTTLVKKKFTVSRFATSGVKTPGRLASGSGFVVKGKVTSYVHSFNYVRVGIKTSGGSWKKGCYASVNPRKVSYDINALDSKIKFGKLKKGTYRYSIWVRNAAGYSKTVINKKFTVGYSTSSSSGSSGTSTSSGKIYSGGRILSYRSSVINSIGAQPVSGPCGIYAMAYCRAVIDGHFYKNGYSTIYSRLINQYGHGGFCAYWGEAGGDSVYYMTARSCYSAALRQLANGKPCVINVYNGYTGNQHYLAVIGYTAGTTYSNVTLSRFIVLDPGYGTVKYLSQMRYYNNSSPQCITF
ncbi:MAG: hypothetical protein ACOX4I_09155 [Anaerovoracaceae bacterium]